MAILSLDHFKFVAQPPFGSRVMRANRADMKPQYARNLPQSEPLIEYQVHNLLLA